VFQEPVTSLPDISIVRGSVDLSVCVHFVREFSLKHMLYFEKERVCMCVCVGGLRLVFIDCECDIYTYRLLSNAWRV
jgi:hypothetical protein